MTENKSLDSILSSAQTIEDIDTETLSSLGVTIDIGGIELPPPSTGVLSLLETCNNPFVGVFKADDIKIYDIFECAFVLIHREETIQYIRDPERFKQAVDTFGLTLGVIDINKEALKIMKYITTCLGGFDMIPQANEPQRKKKDSLTLFGWLKSLISVRK